MPNRLARETSPYLLQHQHNPVDWYPWSPEALAKAKTEDKPILLSIGYSACHWCHVMEHESFEDSETAELMNALYVSIKVDREERPDLDNIYMQAVQAMTGRGGWPLTVFLTPNGEPFYGGTYFPKEERHGMPAFSAVLKGVADAYYNRKDAVQQAVTQIGARLKVEPAGKGEMLTPVLLENAMSKLAGQYDWTHGGFGSAPKFPQPMVLEFLLRSFHRQPDHRVLQMLDQTLNRMAKGGIYDHLGGGFHRYSTDADWLVPHFEKMLYDNAQLARVYLHTYQLTGKALTRRIAEETLDYVLRDLTSPEGGFYSTEDADSEGVEGKFYVWTPQELRETLEPEEAHAVGAYFDVSDEGNFEGSSILNIPTTLEEVARAEGLSIERLQTLTRSAKTKLLAKRGQRVRPGRDEKILTAWNGLMLRTLAEAAVILEREEYRQAAVRNAEFVLSHLWQEGRLKRTYKDGQAKLLGYLEDYALLTDGLIALYEATFDKRWLNEARLIADQMVALFWEEKEGVFYDTGKDHEALIVRPRDVFDNAMPCGGSVASDALLRLAILAGDAKHTRRATRALRSVAQTAANIPNGFANWLSALDFYLSRPFEIAIVGPVGDPATQALLRVVWRAYLPNKVVAGGLVSVGNGRGETLPLLQDRGMSNGKPTAYVCENYACKKPVTDPAALADQLGAPHSNDK